MISSNTVQLGFNKITLDSSKQVKKGSMAILYLSSSSPDIYIDTSGKANYSDYTLSSSRLQKLNSSFNYRLDLNCLIEQTYYLYSFDLWHQYDETKNYNVSFKFFSQSLEITVYKSFNILNSN